ncbi:hypothetical protein ABBQ38_013132 [Trebouxia sp. C0009 RCD-2024]
MSAPGAAKFRKMGIASQPRAEVDLKAVLKSRGGQLPLQDLRSAWEEVHGSALSLPNSDVMALLDRCRLICRCPEQSFNCPSQDQLLLCSQRLHVDAYDGCLWFPTGWRSRVDRKSSS